MPTGLDLMNIWKDGLTNKDSSKLGDIITEDWEWGNLIRGGTRDKQATLDWTDSGGNPTIIDNIEILYENDEVAVGTHGVARGTVMFFARKRGDRFSCLSFIRERNEG